MPGACNCCDTSPEPPKKEFTPERGPTDTFFLLLFIAAWGAVIGILAGASSAGADPARVYRGVDFQGVVCGKGVGSDYPLTVFPDPTYPDVAVCVKNCAVTLDPAQSPASIRTPYTTKAWYDPISSLPLGYYSIEFLNWCVPDPTLNSTAVDALQHTAYNSVSANTSRAMNDLFTAYVMILISAFVALLFAFMYLKFLQYCAGALVLVFMLILVAGGFLTAYGLLQAAADIKNTGVNTDRAKALEALGWITVVLTVIFICVCIFLRSRILLAIEVVKQAGLALGDMPGLVVFPLFPFLFACLYFFFWVTCVVFIFSVQTATDKVLPTIGLQQSLGQANYTSYVFNEGFKTSMAFVFFHLLWQVQFLIYFVFMVIAGAAANWYFAPWMDSAASNKKQRGNPSPEKPGVLPDSPVCASCKRTFACHLGTIAFSSLIIAIIDFIRAVVKYIQEMSKPKNGAAPNKLQQCMFCMIQCCLSCIRCCCDKINKNALIWTAIWGTPLIPSICSSFAFIWANLLRVAAINMVSAYLLFIGKIMVSFATTGIALIVFIKLEYYKTHLSSPVMPCVIIFILAFCIATLFMVIFECCIDTIFLCFLVDEKYNKDTGQMHAHPDLLKLIDAKKVESAELGKQLQDDHPPEGGAAAAPTDQKRSE